jgi:nucleotide-binding universal stress UspA family protein
MPDVCRVVAGVRRSPGSVPALRQAAGLARHHDALLTPFHTWVPPEGDVHERTHPSLELRQLWEHDAWQRLKDALAAAFGGLPAGVRTQPVVRRGQPGKVLTGAARQPGDVLVIGAGRPGGLRRLRCCGTARYCLAHACCPVLAIPPPSLAQQAGHGLRGWAVRRR